jgi:hypothetical protein
VLQGDRRSSIIQSFERGLLHWVRGLCCPEIREEHSAARRSGTQCYLEIREEQCCCQEIRGPVLARDQRRTVLPGEQRTSIIQRFERLPWVCPEIREEQCCQEIRETVLSRDLRDCLGFVQRSEKNSAARRSEKQYYPEI